MAALGDFERFTVCHGTVEVPDRWINDDPAINSNRGRIIIRILRAAGPEEDFDVDTEDTVHDIIIDDDKTLIWYSRPPSLSHNKSKRQYASRSPTSTE
ncbi:hypothetical protein LTR97_009937 [Elasticomyces elasticus]|uniref:Uncharacterized protein n=1 Tax=Elasticomyces elasticus TaxID=574655 RepID=A0AAN8A0R8_9PEZI|nr:hypothetical protein LTR97_009937 [Elasticomyces elasticus]